MTSIWLHEELKNIFLVVTINRNLLMKSSTEHFALKNMIYFNWLIINNKYFERLSELKIFHECATNRNQ